MYLTSGPNRKLNGRRIDGRVAPCSALATGSAAYRPAGEAVRALSWLGPDEVDASLDVIGRKALLR